MAEILVDDETDVGAGTLRSAIEQANATPGLDVITFASGVTTVHLQDALPTISDDLVVKAGEPGRTVIVDANADADDDADTSVALGSPLEAVRRVFDLGDQLTVRFEGMTLTGGATTAFGEEGGGVRGGFDTRVVFVDSSVVDNTTLGASAGGGGIAASVVDLKNSTVARNVTSGAYGDGGGIAADVLTVERSILFENRTAGDFAKGGGASAEYLSLDATSVLGNTTAGNNAGGGGLATSYGDIENSTIASNGTSGFNSGGGGIQGNVNIVSSTITGNSTAGEGAEGGALRGVNKNAFEITNSLILGNVAGGDGVASSANDIFAPVGFEEIGANIIGGNATEVFDDVEEILLDTDGDGDGDVPSGVLGGRAIDHGGPGPTVMLRHDGPAVDAAPPFVEAVEFDQRGVVRPQGTQADLGAVELEPAQALGEVLHAVNFGGDAVDGFTGTSDGRALDFAADDGRYLAAGGEGVYQNPAFGGASSLFGSERWDPADGDRMLFQLPVAAGTNVVVELYFLEIYPGVQSPGSRIFDVSIEGETVLDDFDIVEEAGFGALATRTFEAHVSADGLLDLAFAHGVQNPKISAIAVYAHDTTGAGEATIDTTREEATPTPPEAVDLFG